LQENDFHEIGKVITEALTGDMDDAKRAALTERTRVLAKRYPLYPQLAPSSQSPSSQPGGPEEHPAPKSGGGHA
jgi:hypothetical protein